MRRNALTLVASLFVAILLCSVEVMGQQPRKYPPFTLVVRLTEYDMKGEAIHVSTASRYQSSTGNWRYVFNSGVSEQATIYQRGKGVDVSDSKTFR